MNKAEKTARALVGDGKTPNLYWVCMSADWQEEQKPGSHYFESARELHPKMKEGAPTQTFGPFKTFKGAMDKLENLILMQVTEPGTGEYQSVTIEDRITGIMYEATYYVRKRKQGIYTLTEIEFERTDDSKYAREQLGSAFV